MGKNRQRLIAALLVVVALVVVAILTWRWWRVWLPHPRLVEAWAGYLVTELRMDLWGPLLLLFLLGAVEVAVALTLYRRSTAFERYVRRLDRQHGREVEVLDQEIALLKEEQLAFEAELELRDDLIREQKDHLWVRFSKLQEESGLPQGRLISRARPELAPERRSELRQIIAQLERIETVTSASVRGQRAARRSHLCADELVRLGSACYYLGQLERAQTHYGKALGLASADPEALINRAIVSCALGQHASAIQDLDRALKAGEDAHIYLYRGLCREHVGEDRRALEDYGRAARLDSGFEEVYHQRGLLYARQGEFAKALQDQSRVLELTPDHAGAWAARGVARAAQGDYQAALGDLDRACILAPQDCEGFYQRGLAHCHLEMQGEAVADFTRAIELSPALAPAYVGRADAYLATNEQSQAMADYDRAAELQPKNAAVYNSRGLARIVARDYRGAIGDFDQALELDPSLAVALANRGSAHEKLGDYDQAIRDLDRALVLSPSLALAYYSRGLAYGSKGEYDKASRDLNKAVELDPSLGKKQKLSPASAA